MARQEVIPPPRRRGRRTLSLRDLLNDLSAYRRAVDRGEISSADGQRRVAMVQAHAEVLLVAKQLEMQGVDALVDASPSEDYTPPQITPHRTKKVAVKEGVGRHGERIEEKVVSISTSSPGDDPEPDAEIEALT